MLLRRGLLTVEWKVRHEEKGRKNLESWWERSKNSDLERVVSRIGCMAEKKEKKKSFRKPQTRKVKEKEKSTDKYFQNKYILLSRAEYISEFHCCPISAEFRHICL